MQNDELNELLIKHLLKKHNIFTVDYKSMDSLSNLLKTTYNANISTNTLARLCRLRKDATTPYQHTLDTLAKAAGFFCYQNFVTYIHSKNIIQWTSNPETNLPFISQYTLRASRENDIKYLESLSKYIEDNGCEMDTFSSIGGAMLNGLRLNKNPKKLLEFMATSPIMIDVFFESFVDEDYFSSYFGEGMLQLAKHTNEINRTYLFANSVALMHEKKRGLTNAYQRRAKKLAAIDTNYLDKLFAAHCPYPPARLLGVLIDYWLQQKQQVKAATLFDYAIEQATSVNGDDAIIIINQLTEIGEILPLSFRTKLQELYNQKANSVMFEYNSLTNAALNLALLIPSNPSISPNNLLAIVNNYPSIFITSKATIANKFRKGF